MTETTFRILAGTLENYFNFSERLKIFQINARGGKPACLFCLCGVKYPRYPWHPCPLFLWRCIHQNRPLLLASPATGLPPGTSSLSGWRLTSLPAPIMNLLEPLPTEPLGWALKNVNQIPSSKLQTASPVSRLKICSCRMRKTSGRAVGFLPKDDRRTHLLVVGLICFYALNMETETKELLFFKCYTFMVIWVLTDAWEILYASGVPVLCRQRAWEISSVARTCHFTLFMMYFNNIP